MRHIKQIFLALLFASLATVATAQSEYNVRPGDSLAIEVLEDASLNRSVVVLPDGRFNFPFAGSIQAAGRNATQIQSAISQGITSNFATTPTVFVTVRPVAGSFAPTPTTSAGTIDVYFLGEINSPGVVSVKPGTTLLQAIAISGGVTRFAAVKRVQLRRTNRQTGVQNVITLNYKALANGTASNAIELKDGDVILVPERRLFE
ncbi:MAG: polysaccharide biosynthesis/export family protein [Tateyamaria sp.]|uniref:polysaccharide biosynthesis/export family protein n=1 Tax=Tateyamaria sp. TaxID=1929288 RepID=UPI00329C7189